MTWFPWIQGALAVVLAGFVAERLRALVVRGDLEARPYVAAVRRAWVSGEDAVARRLIEGGRPAWVAEVLAAAQDAKDAGTPVMASVDEVLVDLRFEALRGLRTIRGLSSLGSVSGLLGALIQVVWLLGGNHGLEGLMPGLPEKLAAERAMLSMVFGMAIALVAFGSLRVVADVGKRLLREASDAAKMVERRLDAEQAAPEPQAANG